jgi:leucyl aminopeptidase
MTDLKALLKADSGQPAIAIQLVDKKSIDTWLKAQPARVRRAAEAQGFKGEGFQLAILPGERDDWSAVLGVANVDELSPWCLARAAESLPEGSYRVAGRGPGPAVLGWLLGQYAFDRYRKEKKGGRPRVLLTDEPARIDENLLLAEATFLVRDLVNMPAGDLGPAELEAAALALADETGAKVSVTRDHALNEGYPMIAAASRD